MCDGRIPRNQRLPRNPLNGQVPAWNSTTNQYEAVDQTGGSGLPDGTNSDDVLLWDGIGNEWYASSSPYTQRLVGEIIDGDWIFNMPVTFAAGSADPFGTASPASGFTIGADFDNHLFIKNSLGGIITLRTASISTDVIYDLPSETGQIALRGKTGIHFDSDANVSASLQILKDPANNSLPISVSSSTFAIGRTGAGASLDFVSGDSGFTVSNISQAPGTANMQWGGNNFNFRSNSTGFFFGGGSTFVAPSARIHVRGDGTNPIFRFESLTGTISLQMLNSGALTLNEGSLTVGNGNINVSGKVTSTGGYNNTTGTVIPSFESSVSCANAAGNSNFRPVSIFYAINNSGAQTGIATGIFLNATETNLNGMGHFLIDLQRGAVSQFSVTRTGNLMAAQSIETPQVRWTTSLYNASTGVTMTSTAQTNLTLTNINQNDFSLLRFGGNTNLYPALMRQGNTLEARTADGLTYTQFHAGSYAMSGYAFASLSTRYLIDQDSRGVVFYSNVGLKSSNVANHASAILDVESTTKGVLFPRMTTTQRDAIVAPAESLLIYNTTTRQYQFWNSVAWKSFLTD